MKKFTFCVPALLACLLLLAGCGQTGEKGGAPTPTPTVGPSAEAKAAYEAFLAGDISLFDSESVERWGLNDWDTVLSGELEYTYLDLDGDGGEELLVQWVNDPGSYNGVFHFEHGKLFCWENDMVEATSRNYPLKDGTVVYQYDYNGTYSYTLCQCQPNGDKEPVSTLFIREELIPEDSTAPCPYYEVDGEEVDEETFEEQLKTRVTDQLLDRSAWMALK